MIGAQVAPLLVIRPSTDRARPLRRVGRRRCHYSRCMSIVTAESASLRAAIVAHRDGVEVILRRYKATHPRLFGSVARGDAMPDSDIDLLVDLLPTGGNELLRVAGIAEELSQLLGTRVDVVAGSLLRDEVSASALADSVAV
jgi:predicted nucleotidyltransferase